MKVKYAPKNSDQLVSIGIGYAYPSSPRAEYFDEGKTGCYYIYFNGDNAHTGGFKMLADAEKFAAENYPNLKWDKYSMCLDQSQEQFRPHNHGQESAE